MVQLRPGVGPFGHPAPTPAGRPATTPRNGTTRKLSDSSDGHKFFVIVGAQRFHIRPIRAESGTRGNAGRPQMIKRKVPRTDNRWRDPDHNLSPVHPWSDRHGFPCLHSRRVLRDATHRPEDRAAQSVSRPQARLAAAAPYRRRHRAAKLLTRDEARQS